MSKKASTLKGIVMNIDKPNSMNKLANFKNQTDKHLQKLMDILDKTVATAFRQ
jgi:hypothetical protein